MTKLMVSVFSDSRNPVSKLRVQRILEESNLRLNHLGIELKLLCYYPDLKCKRFSPNYVHRQTNQRLRQETIDNNGLHLRLFVTDKRKVRLLSKKERAELITNSKTYERLGYQSENLISLFGIRRNRSDLDLGDHSQVTTTLLHELGHFFGLGDHVEDPNFLMYYAVASSKGTWHPTEELAIRKSLKKMISKNPTTR